MCAQLATERDTLSETPARRYPRPARDSPIDNCDRVEIQITTREHEINDRVIEAICADPSVYRWGGQLVTIVGGNQSDDAVECPNDAPRIAAILQPTLREIISKHVSFSEGKRTKRGLKTTPKHVPGWCVSAIHAREDWQQIRPLRGIVNHPILKPDGSILNQGGYDHQTGFYLDWSGEPIEVAAQPSQQDAIDAVQRLKHLVVDFPFESNAHRAAWLALLLTALIRHSFPDSITSPLFLLDASIRGSGKTLLADVVGTIICGSSLPRMVFSTSEEEARKAMLCLTMAGDEFVLFDNVAGELGGQTLDAVLTGTTFKDRILGQSRTVSVPINTTFVATANNCSITGDLCRRTIHIRLSSPLENPEERGDFQIPDLIDHVRRNRRAILSDALTILRAYVVAGKPDQKLSKMGSFENWSTAVRAPLVWCGEPDPWETRIDFAKIADSGAPSLADILGNWRSIDPEGKGVTVAEILSQIDSDQQHSTEIKNSFCDLCGCEPAVLPSARVLGKRLSSIRDRTFRGQRLICDPNRKGIMVWRVESVKPSLPGLQGVAGFNSSTDEEAVTTHSFTERKTPGITRQTRRLAKQCKTEAVFDETSRVQPSKCIGLSAGDIGSPETNSARQSEMNKRG